MKVLEKERRRRKKKKKNGGTPSNRFSLSVSYEEASFAFCVSFSDSEK